MCVGWATPIGHKLSKPLACRSKTLTPIPPEPPVTTLSHRARSSSANHADPNGRFLPPSNQGAILHKLCRRRTSSWSAGAMKPSMAVIWRPGLRRSIPKSSSRISSPLRMQGVQAAVSMHFGHMRLRCGRYSKSSEARSRSPSTREITWYPSFVIGEREREWLGGRFQGRRCARDSGRQDHPRNLGVPGQGRRASCCRIE